MNIIIIIILTFDPFEQNIVQMFYNWIASTIPKKMDVWNMNIFKLSIFIQFNHTITINKTFLLQFSHEMHKIPWKKWKLKQRETLCTKKKIKPGIYEKKEWRIVEKKKIQNPKEKMESSKTFRIQNNEYERYDIYIS